VRLREMAGGWHVHYAEYLHYLEMAATDHAETRGYPMKRLTEELGGMFFMRHLEIEYLRPARAYDHIDVITWVTEIRGARVVRRSRIRMAASGATLVEALAEWVWVLESGHPERVPDEVITALTGV
jgi:acyl-CoA thioester hydrolase